MSRAMIFTVETNANLKADRIEEDENGYIRVYNGNEFVGIFDISVVRAAYISGKESKNEVTQ